MPFPPTVRILYLILLLGLWIVPSATAQSFQNEHEAATEVGIEWMKPFFGQDNNFTFLTSVAHFNARIAFTPRFALVGTIPLAHLGVQTDDLDLSETNPGNGYVGLQLYAPTQRWRATVGARLPLASEDASALGIGFLTDYENLGAYIPQTLTLSAEGAAFANPAPSLRLEAMLRPAILLFTGDSDADSELFVRYAARGWYHFDPVRVGVGFSGITLLSEDELDTSEQSVLHATLYLAADIENIRPGVFVRLPIDEEIGDVVDVIVGIGITATLED